MIISYLRRFSRRVGYVLRPSLEPSSGSSDLCCQVHVSLPPDLHRTPDIIVHGYEVGRTEGLGAVHKDLLGAGGNLVDLGNRSHQSRDGDGGGDSVAELGCTALHISVYSVPEKYINYLLL